jgi:signal transduction histidine kinase
MTVAVFFGTVFFTSAIIIRLRRVNRRLQGANAQLSALDLTKSRFLRTSSHQLRGPLAAIHSMVSAIREAGGFNPKQNEFAARINRRAEEAMAQLDEMLLLSTIQEKASETGERRPVNVRAVLDQVASSFAEEAQNKGLTFEVDLAEAPAVSAWEDALETIMEHLLGNAIKYTPSGGRVGLSSRLSGRQVEIRVSDTGIGIPPEQQEQVFREFFRATNARQVGGGTGLGLSIVKATVERLGGSIALDSAEGRGTTITVRLPIGADAPARSESPQELSGHEAAPQTRAG